MAILAGVLVWWLATAPPSLAEVEAAIESGETPVVIRGWEVAGAGATPPRDSETSWVEAWISRPVTPLTKLRAWLPFLAAAVALAALALVVGGMVRRRRRGGNA